MKLASILLILNVQIFSTVDDLILVVNTTNLYLELIDSSDINSGPVYMYV